jgi:hypothetical protein
VYSVMECTYSVTADQGTMPVKVFFLLSEDSKQIKIRTELENKWSKYRLRAVFPTPYNVLQSSVYLHKEKSYEISTLTLTDMLMDSSTF